MKPSSLSWAILIVLSLVWGSSFILMKQGLKAFSSDEVAALRIAIAFLFLAPLHIKHFSRLQLKNNWKGLLLMGVFGNFIPAFLFTLAETQISSSLAGMLNALTPLFTILIGVLVYRTAIHKHQLIGVIIGLVGAILLLGFGNSTEQSKDIMYSMLVVLATLCYAISVNGIKRHLSGINSVTASVWSFTLIGPAAIAYLFINTDFKTHLSDNEYSTQALGYISILAIAGTAISVIIYNVLIKQTSAVFASSCTYLIPIVAIGWGLSDNEPVSLIQIAAIGIIILGIWLLNKRQNA